MAKARRVFQIAKELGVNSKAIVEKCAAEDVPGITNHMSTVKVGLEVTIKEWFGDAAQVATATAIETTDKVDLAKARKGVRRRKPTEKSTEPEPAEAAVTETPTEAVVTEAPTEAVVTEAPTEAVATEAPAEAVQTGLAQAVAGTGPYTAPVVATSLPPQATTSTEQQPAEVQATAAPPAEPVAFEPDQTDTPEVTLDAPTSVQRPPSVVGTPNVPRRPTVVKPAGEQLKKPKQAVLKGPKVVRVEKPDAGKPPPAKPAPAKPAPAPGTVEGIARSRGPVRGRGAVDDHKAGDGQKNESRQPKGKILDGKRRSLTSRRGRSADAQIASPGSYSEQDLIELDARLRGAPGYLRQRRRDMKNRQAVTHAAPTPAEVGGTVDISEPITIKNLSAATGIKSTDIIKYLFQKGIMATINSSIDVDAGIEVALEYDIELNVKEQQTAEQEVLKEFEGREEVDKQPRAPVVTVLGHVDHGKTSLLDKIRQADVAGHEAGGITQHVGAYRIINEDGQGNTRTVVFLDTPGHEAFTSMRLRGANMTDVVVLVVAADDGVMPQTVESINHANAAGVPIVVALNKIDRPEATDENIRRIYGQLAEHELNPVEWGGDTEIVKVSAITGDGVNDLLEHLDYQAELLELTADFGGPARGTVIESQMQEGRGPVARVLVQQGRIKVGDFIVIGRSFGRVRDMTDDHGLSVAEAGPSTPLELSGIDLVPDAGDKFYVTETLRKADEVAQQYRDVERQQQLASTAKVTLDTFADTLKAGNVKELRVVLKADVQGSLDVLKKILSELGNDEVQVRVLHAAVGGINESDVLLAEASDAVTIGFHVVASPHARDLAEQRAVEMRLYRVIYDIADDIKKALEGMLAPTVSEEIIGEAEVREIFNISKLGNIAGCLVTEGAIHRSGKLRVVRDDVVVTDSRSLESLRRVKEDVTEIRAGTECGIRLDGFDDVKPGDRLVCYNVVTVERKLN